MTVEARDAGAGFDSEGVARDDDGHRSTRSKMRCAPSLPFTSGRCGQGGKDQWWWATATCRCHDDPDWPPDVPKMTKSQHKPRYLVVSLAQGLDPL